MWREQVNKTSESSLCETEFVEREQEKSVLFRTVLETLSNPRDAVEQLFFRVVRLIKTNKHSSELVKLFYSSRFAFEGRRRCCETEKVSLNELFELQLE